MSYLKQYIEINFGLMSFQIALKQRHIVLSKTCVDLHQPRNTAEK